MKKLNITLMFTLIGVLALIGTGFCADITVTAQVPSATPSIATTILLLTTAGQDPFTGTTVTSMNFGQLTHTLSTGGEAGVWFSPNYFAVMIFTSSFGHRYEIRSSCAGLVSGSNSLPTGSFGLTPGYAALDRWVSTDALSAQGAMPSGATQNTAGVSAITGVGNFKSIYMSETAASNRIIRAFYSLPGYAAGGAAPFSGYQPIPLSQAAGTYTGTVTITIAAI